MTESANGAERTKTDMTYFDVTYQWTNPGRPWRESPKPSTMRVTAQDRHEAIRLVESVETQLADLGFAPVGATFEVIEVEERRR